MLEYATDEVMFLNTYFQAENICVSCGQAWRAASLQGWKLYRDPNFEKLGPECQREPVFGNPYRDVWKKVCWNMCQSVSRLFTKKLGLKL